MNNIRKITPDGVVTTLAGKATPTSAGGYADGIGSQARFYEPYGLGLDDAANVYVADSSNQTIRKITPEGLVTTLAGKALSRGNNDGVGTAARFDYPMALALDSIGNIYIADQGGTLIRKISPTGVVTTLAGGQRGGADGTGSAARFNEVWGIAVDSTGNVYLPDWGNRTIRKGWPALVLSPSVQSGGMFGISFRSLAGKNYLLDYSDSLSGTNWLTLPSEASGNGDRMTFTNFGGTGGQRFYRVRQQ